MCRTEILNSVGVRFDSELRLDASVGGELQEFCKFLTKNNHRPVIFLPDLINKVFLNPPMSRHVMLKCI